MGYLSAFKSQHSSELEVIEYPASQLKHWVLVPSEKHAVHPGITFSQVSQFPSAK